MKSLEWEHCKTSACVCFSAYDFSRQVCGVIYSNTWTHCSWWASLLLTFQYFTLQLLHTGLIGIFATSNFTTSKLWASRVQEFQSDKKCLSLKQNTFSWVNFVQLLESVFFSNGWDFFHVWIDVRLDLWDKPPCCSWIICHFLFPCILFPPPMVPILGPCKL